MIYLLIWLTISVACTGFVLLCIRSAPRMDDVPLDSLDETVQGLWADKKQHRSDDAQNPKASFGSTSRSRSAKQSIRHSSHLSKPSLMSYDQDPS